MFSLFLLLLLYFSCSLTSFLLILLPLLLNSVWHRGTFLICLQTLSFFPSTDNMWFDQSKIRKLKLLLLPKCLPGCMTLKSTMKTQKLFSCCSEHRSQVKTRQGWVQLPQMWEAKGKLLLREVTHWLKFTMKYKWLMSTLLLKQKLMKGRAEIRKGVESFKEKGAIGRRETSMQKEEARGGQMVLDLHFILNPLYPSIRDVWKYPVIFSRGQVENKTPTSEKWEAVTERQAVMALSLRFGPASNSSPQLSSWNPHLLPSHLKGQAEL